MFFQELNAPVGIQDKTEWQIVGCAVRQGGSRMPWLKGADQSHETTDGEDRAFCHSTGLTLAVSTDRLLW